MAALPARVRFLWGSLYARSKSAFPAKDSIATLIPTNPARNCSVVILSGFRKPAFYSVSRVQSGASETTTRAGRKISVPSVEASLAVHYERRMLRCGVSPLSICFRSSFPSSPSSSFSSPHRLLSCFQFPRSPLPWYGVASQHLLGSAGTSRRRSSGRMCAAPAQSRQQEAQPDNKEQHQKAQQQHERRNEHQKTQHTLAHYNFWQGRQRQHQEGWQQQADDTKADHGHRAFALVAVSPLLFTRWDDTSNPKTELIFLAGNTLGYCTEKFFENEYGQSIFACVLGLVYLALLGYEGKINGAVWRMKHVFSTNMKIIGHPRYAYALPRNRLLSSSQQHHR